MSKQLASGRAGFDRRQWFRAAGAAAAGELILAEAVSRADDPAANVEDRVTSLKMTSLRATPVGPKCFVKIETNHGITGWGEITGLDPAVAARLAESLYELLDGEN